MRSRVAVFLAGSFALASIVFILAKGEDGNRSQRALASQGESTKNYYLQIWGEVSKRTDSTSNDVIVGEMHSILDEMPSSERSAAFNDAEFMRFYLGYAAYDAKDNTDSRRRVKAILASENLSEDFHIKSTNGQMRVQKATFLAEELGGEELASLADLGFDLSSVDPEILKKKLANAHPSEDQRLRDLFGKYLNQSHDDYRAINFEGNGATPGQVKAIENGLEKILKQRGAAACFDRFQNNKVDIDTVQFCHESYKFFDKIFDIQKTSKSAVQRIHALALSKCAIQINFKSDLKGSPFQSKDNSKEPGTTSSVQFRPKRIGKDGKSKFADPIEVDFNDFFDFASEVCPGYIAIYRENGLDGTSVSHQKVHENRDYIYNISFEKFACWKKPRPTDCILSSSTLDRLDGAPALNDSSR